jgi:glycosyltransferase involved in cell wall biosynthesis
MDYPLITIGITCFNAEDTIERCIHSALVQDWPNVEILVVDDCSKDSSPTLIEKLAAKNSSIRFIRHEKNKGCAGSRNTIIHAARGEYIAFFDDDDVSLCKRLTEQFRIFTINQNERILCYSSGIKKYNNDYAIERPAVGSQGTVPAGDDIFFYVFTGETQGKFWGDGTPTATMMAKTRDLIELGCFDESLRRVEDVDLAIRAGMNGFKFQGTAEKVVERYDSPGADKVASLNYQAELFLVNKYKFKLKELELYQRTYIWFRIRSAYFNKKFPLLLWFFCLFAVRFPNHFYHKFMSSIPQRLKHEINMRREKM